MIVSKYSTVYSQSRAKNKGNVRSNIMCTYSRSRAHKEVSETYHMYLLMVTCNKINELTCSVHNSLVHVSCHDRGHVFLFLYPFPIICLTPSVPHPYVILLSLLSLLSSMPDGYTLLGLKAVMWPHTASLFTRLCYLWPMLCDWLHPALMTYDSCCASLYYISRASCSGTC